MPTTTKTDEHIYARPGMMTDPGEYEPLLDVLPRDVESLVQGVQGLLVHVFWSERYGLQLPDERKQHELNLRTLHSKLARILELDDRPLSEPRPLEQRLVGNCRDFSLLLTAFLRHQGIPARARCGFGTYFIPDHFEDHWVVEYWDAAQARWVMVDAQLDALQQEALGIGFDTLDLPPGQFVTGGTAWQLCRSGQEDPDKFGIFDMKGLWFVRGDLLRDFYSLNKVEILPWDHWGLMDGADEAMSAADLALLDGMAALCVPDTRAYDELMAMFAEPRVAMPDEVIGTL